MFCQGVSHETYLLLRCFMWNINGR